jgi:hypothetical protein
VKDSEAVLAEVRALLQGRLGHTGVKQGRVAQAEMVTPRPLISKVCVPPLATFATLPWMCVSHHT